MAGYAADTLVTVRPFHRYHNDATTVTIGNHNSETYLTIPTEGLTILDHLATGNTVSQTVKAYEATHHHTPDINDFLTTLQAEGFVSPADTTPTPEPTRRKGLELRWITQRMARAIFNLPMLAIAFLTITAGIWMATHDPGLLPTNTVMLFPHHFGLLTWMTFAWTLTGVFIHELAHLLAARAAGIPARIQIGHRLYVPVAETDMTGIWLAPRRWRFMGFLSGPLFDLVSVSIVIGILYASRHGLFHLSQIATMWLTALIFTYGARIVWQSFLFLRTDFYYTIAHALKCKSLMSDTETMLRNKIAFLFRRPRVDQSAIPARERWAARLYSILWIIGRTAAIAALIFLSGPILIGYLTEVAHLITGAHTRFTTFDFATIGALAILMDLTGLFLWLRSLTRTAFRRKTGSIIETK